MTRHFDYCQWVNGHQYQWLAGGYDLETTYLEMAWIVAFYAVEHDSALSTLQLSI